MPLIRSIILFLAVPWAVTAQLHFNPVDSTGLPYLVIIEPDPNAQYTLMNGDEIGLFTDSLCVGAGIYPDTGNFPITTWRGDPTYNLTGFDPSDSIQVRVWINPATAGQEYPAVVTLVIGDGTFGYGTYSVIRIDIPLLSTVNYDPVIDPLPGGYLLGPNYPNPFNSRTIIPYKLSKPALIKLVVLDMAGREIALLVNGWKPAGWHQVFWNGRFAEGKLIPSGAYIYRLETPEGSTSQTLILVK